MKKWNLSVSDLGSNLKKWNLSVSDLGSNLKKWNLSVSDLGSRGVDALRPSLLVGTVSINEKKHNDAAALNVPQMLPHSKVS
jgi:hypothetical protein